MQANQNAILISGGDNVVTVIEAVERGGTVRYLSEGAMKELIVVDAIPPFHKAAVADITVGENVIKYGQIMAVATAFIPRGSHVHTHNVQSSCKAEGGGK